jgi:hypothetical protein
MENDTKYWNAAVEAWCKKHPWDKNLPVTPAWFSEMAHDAQVLKAADRARANNNTAATKAEQDAKNTYIAELGGEEVVIEPPTKAEQDAKNT